MKTAAANYGSMKKWYHKNRIANLLKELRRRGFQAEYHDDVDSLKKALLRKIPKKASIGIPGSVTIREIGIIEELKKRGNKIFQHWREGLNEKIDQHARSLEGQADYYLTSSNAITIKGELINIDGVGNRVAHMVFGPKNVFVVVGVNKIVDSIEQGLERAHQVAGVMNARRVEARTPCVKTGVCSDCSTPGKICRVISIIKYRPFQTKITVMLINKELGF